MEIKIQLLLFLITNYYSSNTGLYYFCNKEYYNKKIEISEEFVYKWKTQKSKSLFFYNNNTIEITQKKNKIIVKIDTVTGLINVDKYCNNIKNNSSKFELTVINQNLNVINYNFKNDISYILSCNNVKYENDSMLILMNNNEIIAKHIFHNNKIYSFNFYEPFSEVDLSVYIKEEKKIIEFNFNETRIISGRIPPNKKIISWKIMPSK